MKRNSKLLLSRTTVRTLSHDDLAAAAGGASLEVGSCNPMSARSNSAVDSVYGCTSDGGGFTLFPPCFNPIFPPIRPSITSLK